MYQKNYSNRLVPSTYHLVASNYLFIVNSTRQVMRMIKLIIVELTYNQFSSRRIIENVRKQLGALKWFKLTNNLQSSPAPFKSVSFTRITKVHSTVRLRFFEEHDCR